MSHTVAGHSRYGSNPSFESIFLARSVGAYPSSFSSMNPQARFQCLMEVTMLRPTPNLAIDSSSAKTDRGALGPMSAILSNAFRSQSCLSGNVSCPENCKDGAVNECGTP